MTRQEIVALALQDIQGEAMDSAYDRFDLLPKVAGALCAIGGSLVLGAWLPGVGPWLAWGVGFLIPAGGLVVSAKEGAAIERGDMEAVKRHLDDDRINRLVTPYLQKLQGEADPKPLPHPSQPERPNSEMGTQCNAAGEPTSGETAPGESKSTANLPIEAGTLSWADGEHLVMIGLSGSSKSTTLIQCVPEGGLTIYVTLKVDDVAPPEWQAYRLSKFADMAFLAQLDDLCDLIERLVRRGEKHRLIIDEALSILDLSKDAVKTLVEKEDRELYRAVPARFEGLVKLYIRTGRSDGHYLGLVTQSPNGTDLFESAKTMQGLKTVLCAGEASSNKFAYLVSWAQQLYGQWLTPANLAHLQSVQAGFWHFWLEGGKLHGAHTQRSDRELVPCPEFSRANARAAAMPVTRVIHPEPAADDDLNWEAIAIELCTTPADAGLRRSLAMVLEIDPKTMTGPRWQALRDGLKAAMPELPIELQQQLRAKYSAVDLG